MSYRFKTHAELVATGFVLTPAGTYLHSRFEPVNLEMVAYASQFKPELIQLLCDLPTWSSQAMFVDKYTYCAQHFAEI
jgi:hypothetical protein